jgi:hypothetical protein
MSFNGKFFAPQIKTPIEYDPNSFMAKLMRQKGHINQGLQTSLENKKEVSSSDFMQRLRASRVDPDTVSTIPVQKEVSSSDFMQRLRASRVEPETDSYDPKSETENTIEISKEEFLKQLSLKKSTNTTSHMSFISALLSPSVEQEQEQEQEPVLTHEEYIAEMKKKRDSHNSKRVTTLTYDFAKGDTPTIAETELSEFVSPNMDLRFDEESCIVSKDEKKVNPEELLYLKRYTYEHYESLTTTPTISKENMINFLSKQGANGGFNPVDAFNNTLSDTDRAQIKEDTIRKNIGVVNLVIGSKSENEKIIEELSARKSSLTKAEKKTLDEAEKKEKARKKNEKEVAKALKGPSKKVQEIISKKETIKEEKVLTEDDKYLEKLGNELKAKRIKTVNDAAYWIVIISKPENKIKGFELLFMGILDPILRKIIYVEIIRRITIEEIKSKKFREAIIKFSKTFSTNELIKFQLKEMENIIPPFSPFEKKKMCLDPWQTDVFKYINQKFSILIDAPTAAGKTVCATYCVTVCEKVLFVLPSKELANQVAGVIRSMKTATSSYTPIKLITGENIYEDINPKVFIGTAVDLERYFNLENAQRITKEEKEQKDHYSLQFDIDTFNYIIVDEIHLMNVPDQGCAMQRLIKRFTCPMLGLSATIGNPEELRSWLEYLKETTPSREVKRISYDKRFINQQKHVWDGKELISIHPLSVITLDDLQTGKLARTEMQFIPKDLFILYDQMEKLYPREAIESVVPEIFFENACIGLNECKGYESMMKQLLGDLSQTYPDQTARLISHFAIEDISLETLGPKDLYRVLKQMQYSKKLPAIIFKFDPISCKKVANDLLEWMEQEEQEKYPLYRETRELQSKHFKQMKEKIGEIDKESFRKSDDIKSDKLDRENIEKDKCLKEFKDEFLRVVGHNIHKYMSELDNPKISEERKTRLEFYITHYTKEIKDVERMNELTDINVFAPHPDFTFSNASICMSTMIEIKTLLKDYTSQIIGDIRLSKKKLTNNFNIGYNHFFLKSIERGFVLYLNALPLPFQRIAQMLIANGGAPITFSDKSLSVGVNYGIRSVGLLGSTSNDIIDKSTADQASGRSGRRGLDTKGHTIYIGVNWKELTSSEYIKVTGTNPDNEYMSLPQEFNTKFDTSRLALVSLSDYSDIISDHSLTLEAQREKIKTLEKDRMQSITETHEDLVERLGLKNFMNVYRLSEYGYLSESIIDFLLFISEKMYSGISIEKSDLFEMIGTLVDNYTEELAFSNQQNGNLMYEFQEDMSSKGVMIELHGCNSLTRSYKRALFSENISISMGRLLHINEIIRILYNQTRTMSKTNKWVDMLLSIFDEIKSHIFKNII